ncbi:MAG: hypothetical protein RL272_877 [Candidatus Parcubacteria bacterium]|jgi:hypothetical protein
MRLHAIAVPSLFVLFPLIALGAEPRRPPALRAAIPGSGIEVCAPTLKGTWTMSAMKAGDAPAMKLVDGATGTIVRFMIFETEKTPPEFAAVLAQATMASKGFRTSAVTAADETGEVFRATWEKPSDGGVTIDGEILAWQVPGTGKTALIVVLRLSRLTAEVAPDIDAIVKGTRATAKTKK